MLKLEKDLLFFSLKTTAYLFLILLLQRGAKITDKNPSTLFCLVLAFFSWCHLYPFFTISTRTLLYKVFLCHPPCSFFSMAD